MLLYSSRLFTLLWAIALILSGLSPTSWSGPFELLWPSLLLVSAGLILLVGYRNILALRFSSALCVIGWLEEMPVIPNHRWVHLCVALAVFVGGRSAKSIPDLFATINGTLRWLIVIVYFFAALAKMNFDYFDSSISCSGFFVSQILDLYGIKGTLTGDVSHLISLWSLVMELFLPILLLWPRTRQIGVWLGVLFHTSLSLHYVKYFANFSSVMFVLLASWMSEDRCKTVSTRLTTRSLALSRVSIGAAFAIILLSFLEIVTPVEYALARHVLFLGYAVRLSLLTFGNYDQSECKRRVGAPIAFILLIELLNGFSPYLGLKTRSALSMYSNLRIEPEYSNHFFMPPSFDPFGYFGDTVDIIETADPGLKRRIQSESPKLSYLTFCAYVSCQDDLCNRKANGSQIVYKRGSELHTRIIGGDDIPKDCPSWIARKLVFIGPLGSGSERSCTW
jgi:hypothetical protein